MSAETCSQLLEHGIELLALTINAAPKPSGLNLSNPDGTAPHQVAVAVADLLDAQPSPVQHPAIQSGAPQPDSTHSQKDPSQKLGPQLELAIQSIEAMLVPEGFTAEVPRKVQSITADKAAPVVLQEAAQHHMTLHEVIWQIFQYAEELTLKAVETVWTSLAMTGNHQLQLADLVYLDSD